MAHQIIDNFLDQEDFKKLKETVLSNSFPWYFEPVVNELHSKKDKTSFKKELAKVLIHGILHILGYDHEKTKSEAEEMELKENKYLSKVF